MEFDRAVQALTALAQSHRLAIYRLLVGAGPAGRTAGEIAQALHLAAPTLSFHLKTLTQAGLIRVRQEGRHLHYSTDFAAMHALIDFLSEHCCGGAPHLCDPNRIRPIQEEPDMSERVYNVLFLCTGNSARSIIAEAVLNAMGRGRFRAFSAGSHPTGQVNPYALELIARNRLPTEALRSKSWDEFAAPGAPQLDFVFTVCDRAAEESCPVWPGQPMTAHWGVPDPAAVQGTEEEKRRAFLRAWTELANRISIFVSLPFDKLDRLALQRRLDEIGRTHAEHTA